MAPPDNSSRTRDWYKVSVDSLRGCAALVAAMAVGALAVWGWVALRPRLLEREARREIAAARELLERLSREAEVEAYRGKIQAAASGVERAQRSLAAGQSREATREARASRTLLSSLLDALLNRRPLGDAQFISVQGGVEFRRGDRRAWQPATAREALNSGDYVKTRGNGWAELMFADGTLYTVQPDTLFVVRATSSVEGGAEEQAIVMEYGWVNLSTSRRPSTVATPAAEARVAQQSEGLVSYDQGRRQGRFAAFRGALEVRSSEGERRAVGELEEVTVASGALSPTRPLPRRPVLVAPADNAAVDPAAQDRLLLRWQAVPGAVRYALQVSRSRLFMENVIDVADRSTPQATLGIRGSGSFLWRVAAYGAEGEMGPWSEQRRFRITAAPPPAPAAGER